MIDLILRTQIHHKDYIKLINQYEIIPREQLNSYIGPTLELREPTKRRELKIQQFKLEREIKSKLDVRSFLTFFSSSLLL